MHGAEVQISYSVLCILSNYVKITGDVEETVPSALFLSLNADVPA